MLDDTVCSECASPLWSDEPEHCPQCGQIFVRTEPPTDAGWYPASGNFWLELHSDGHEWTDVRQMEPDDVARGLSGSVFVYPRGVVWGQLTRRVLKKYTISEILASNAFVHASLYTEIIDVAVRNPAPLQNGRWRVTTKHGQAAGVSNFMSDLPFDKGQVEPMQRVFVEVQHRRLEQAALVDEKVVTRTDVAPGWYVDPAQRHELRFFDGATWQDFVVDGFQHRNDPLAQV